MSLLSLPRELLYLVFHSLSVDQVDKLTQCTPYLNQLLTSEEYWYARASFDGANRRWSQLAQVTRVSWSHLYHTYLARVDITARKNRSSAGSCWSRYLSFVFQQDSVAWDITGDLFVVDYDGCPELNLSARGIRVRQESDGSFAIIYSKPYPDCGGEGSEIIYINEENELWMFVHYRIPYGEKVCHHLLAMDVRAAGSVNSDTCIIFVVTLTGEFLVYEEHWSWRLCDTPRKLFCCKEDVCNRAPIERSYFDEMLCPEDRTIVQIIGLQSRSCYIRTSNNQCYYYNGKLWEFVHEAEMIYSHSDGIIFYHSELGWGYHFPEIWNKQCGFYPKLEEEVILIQGRHFCHYRDSLCGAADLINARSQRRDDILAIRYK